jgi:hypothetical protein
MYSVVQCIACLYLHKQRNKIEGSDNKTLTHFD